MKYGKILFIDTNLKREENFGITREINSNFNFLISLQLSSNRAIALTKDLDILEWNSDQTFNNPNFFDYTFLLQKPVYLTNKIKFKKLFINSSLSMGMDVNGGIFVWGSHNDGLLGLGYNLTHVETPTFLINNMKELSISDSHAVAIDQSGDIFSWGSGKYGELCLDKLVYCPKPSKKVYENQENKTSSNNNISNLNITPNVNSNGEVKKYRKVFCSDLLTCFIDEEGKFSYYGVIIKIFKDDNRSITIKSLLKDENNSDPNFLFKEKIIYELENEKFIQISIGNGFLGLLSEKGLVYTLDHSDNITLLYTKFFVYSICVSSNQLFGLCRNINNKQMNFPNQSVTETCQNILLDEEEINENKLNNYYLCRWIAQFYERDIISDSWTTQLFKIKDEIDVENMSLLDSHNKEILFIIQYVSGYSKKLALNVNASNDLNNSLTCSINKDNKNNRYDYRQYNYNNNFNENHHSKSVLKESFAANLNENKIENFNMSGLNLRRNNSMENCEFNALTPIGFFDDSYNLKYKRVKNNFHGVRIVSLDKSKNKNSLINVPQLKKQSKNEEDVNNTVLGASLKKKKLDIPKSTNIVGNMNNRNSLSPPLNPKFPDLMKQNTDRGSFNNKNKSINNNFESKFKNNTSNFELKGKLSNENMITDNYENKKTSKNFISNQSDNENNFISNNNDSNHVISNNNPYENNGNSKNKNFKLSTFSNFSSNDVISPSPESLVQFYNDSAKDSKKIENFINFKKPFKSEYENNLNLMNKNNLKNNNDKELSLTLENKSSEVNDKNYNLNRTQEKEKMLNVIATFSDISSERNTTSPNKNLYINKKSLNSVNNSNNNLVNIDFPNNTNEKQKQFFPEEELNLDNEHLDYIKKEKVEDIDFISNTNPYKNRSNKRMSNNSLKKQQSSSSNRNENSLEKFNSGSRLKRDNNFIPNHPIQNITNNNYNTINSNQSHNKKAINNKGKFTNLNIVDDYETEFNNSLISKSKNRQIFKNEIQSPKNNSNVNFNDEADEVSSNKTSEEMSSVTQQSYKRQKKNSLQFENQENKYKAQTKTTNFNSVNNNKNNSIRNVNLNPNNLEKSSNSQYRNERFNSFNLNSNTNNLYNFSSSNSNGKTQNNNPNNYKKNRYHDRQTSYVPFKKNENHAITSNMNINTTNKNFLNTIRDESDSDEKLRKSSMDKKINEFKKKLNKENSSSSSNNIEINNGNNNARKSPNSGKIKDEEIPINKTEQNEYNVRIIQRRIKQSSINDNNKNETLIETPYENKSVHSISIKNFKEKIIDFNEYNDSIDNLKQNEVEIFENSMITGNKLSFKNYKNDEKNTFINTSKYFTFSPGELSVPSIQESDKILMDKRKETNINKILKNSFHENNSNINNDNYYHNSYSNNDINKVSNHQLETFNNPDLKDNSNKIFNETKMFAIVKGIEFIINLFDSRTFRFIYSNMNLIYLNFFKRLKLISEFSTQSNQAFNRNKTISRSNSSNSNYNEQNNFSKKSHETQNRQIFESNSNIPIMNNKFIENMIHFNSQSNQNNNSSNFNSTLENNPNFKNFIRNIHLSDLNRECNGNLNEDSKNIKNCNVPNENYFSFENFNLNSNNVNNPNSLKNTMFVESVNNLDNPKNNSNSIYNNFKFNSFSNKYFVNNTFNRSNDNSDNVSNKNQNSDKKSTKPNLNSNVNSNSVSPYNTISDTTSKFIDPNENRGKITCEFAVEDPNKNNELLYFTKFLVKNIVSFYKRNKSEIFFYVLKKIINHCNFKVVLGVLNKRIMSKHYTTLNHYFMKFRRFNKVFNGILVLNSIYYKNLFHFFSIFGHLSRLYHIKKKYLHEFLEMLEVIRINKMKKKFIFSLAVNRYFDIKMPYFKRFLTTIFELIIYNVKKKTFSFLKKIYYSQKLFQRNLINITRFLESLVSNRKRKGFEAIKELGLRNSLLRNFIKRKHTMRLFYFKKVFQKFVDNALLSDKNLFTNIKLKKALKIFFYKQKLILFKYLYKWKNKSNYLSKFVRDAEKPLKYNLSNEMKSISVKKPKLKTSHNTFGNSNFFDSRLSSPTKIQNNCIKRLVNLLTYITNKATFECLYYHSFGKILSTNLKFDKSLYYINIFNSNYRLKSQASVEHFNYDTQPNFFSSNNSNFNLNNNINNSNFLQNRISFESSLESHKNKTQLTFVCNNENITESDKFQDLQYYLMQGHKQISKTLQLDSPNKKNMNLPLSMNSFNSLTTPKFLVGTGKHLNVNITSPEKKNKNENVKNFSTICTNSNQNNFSAIKKQNINFNNTISSPQNNILTNSTIRKNESFYNTNSFKNSVQSSSTYKNNPTNKNSNNNSVKNEINRSSNSKTNHLMRNSETEKNIFLNDRRVKNKKETNYINININIKDEKSDFNKIAELFDNRTKFYLSTRNRENNVNKDSNRSNSIKNNSGRNKISTKNDFFTYKNLPFNGNITTKKKFSDTSTIITSPLRRISKNKSNSISNYIDLNNKSNYQTDYNLDYQTITNSSNYKKGLNFPFKNYCGNSMKNSKKYLMTKNVTEDSYSNLNKLNNIRPEDKNYNINRLTISPETKNILFFNDIKNNNLRYKRFTNNYNNTINNNDTRVNFANTYNFHTYNPSMHSINTTINNPYSKNHLMILLSVINEKMNKLKRFFFKKLLLFTENNQRTNKKYAIRLIIKIFKRRIIWHKLNFFTRITNYIPNKKEVKKISSNNDVYLNTMKSDKRFIQNPTNHHRKNYSYIESNLNTIDLINYGKRTQNVFSQFTKPKK